MRNTLAGLCLLFYMQATAQQAPGHKTYDFSGINPKKVNINKLDAQEKRMKDSLSKTAAIDSLDQLYNWVNRETHSYDGFIIGVSFPYADIGKINKELSENNFPLLSEHITELHFGFVFKEKRWIKELLYDFSLGDKSTYGNTTIKLFEGNLGLHVGYDLANLSWLTLYPFLGLGYGGGQLTIDGATGGGQNSLTGTFTDYPQTKISKGQLDGTAGGEIDFNLLRPARKNNTYIILAAQYGVSARLIDGKYKANNHAITYHPDWSFRDNYWSLSVKIGG